MPSVLEICDANYCYIPEMKEGYIVIKTFELFDNFTVQNK